MPINYDYASPTKVNGVLLRSRSEAAWYDMLRELGVEVAYEPSTFVFPEGSSYTPDFFLPRFNRWVEVKNKNVDLAACQRINRLAHYLGSFAVLLDGSPKTADAYTFDGRPPAVGWETSPEPVNEFAYEHFYGGKLGAVLGVLFKPNAYEPYGRKLPSQAVLNGIHNSMPFRIDYDISPKEIEELRTKISGGNTKRIILPEETPEMVSRYNALPERKIGPVDYTPITLDPNDPYDTY